MPVEAIIFDMDGTLLDTNHIHVEAWQRAFARCGFEVAASRIAPEIGKGADTLVPSVLDDEKDATHRARLREFCGEEFLRIAGSRSFRMFPGVPDLLETLRTRGLKTALATSSRQDLLEAIERSAGCDLQGMVDVVITASDAKRSKPAPDIVLAAVAKLGIAPDRCIMIGDTPHDAEACRRAEVAFAGVTTGGHDENTLRAAGAVAVWKDAAELLQHLDELLACELLSVG